MIAQELTEQAPVTAWPERLVLTVAVLGVIGLAVWAMWRSWRRRIARQDWVEVAALPGPGAPTGDTYGARYVATVPTDNWLDRIAAHDLGMPGRAQVTVGPAGMLIVREGAADVFLPTELIRDVATARGMAQEVYEREGLVAVTWRSGDRLVTTGLRMDGPDDHIAVVSQVSALIGKAEV